VDRSLNRNEAAVVIRKIRQGAGKSARCGDDHRALLEFGAMTLKGDEGLWRHIGTDLATFARWLS
jgi:hypothetical protein